MQKTGQERPGGKLKSLRTFMTCEVSATEGQETWAVQIDSLYHRNGPVPRLHLGIGNLGVGSFSSWSKQA